MRPEDRSISRFRDILHYGERAKETVAGRPLDELQRVEIDALCYLILIVSEATVQALALDGTLAERYPNVPWRDIRATGNRLRHGYASIDFQVVHEVVAAGHVDQLLAVATEELKRLVPDAAE